MDSQDHYLLGKQLGSCVLESVIGAGGMGMVFLAQQSRPMRRVAVKVLNVGLDLATDQSQEFLLRFRREADLVAQLDHINILPIHEYGEQDGLAYLVMPHLTGGSLRDRLKIQPVLDPREALAYIEQAAAALDYAHAHKIIHRDIKPANMLFHSDGRLVLVDFGIARMIRENSDQSLHTITSSEQVIGSVEYMAPEMVNGAPVSPRTDIYELGVVLFQMLAGRVPFESSSIFLLASKHVTDTPPFLFQLNSSISPEIDLVVQKALAKNPEDRFASAHDLAQALRTAIETPSIIVRKNQFDPAATAPEQGMYAPIPNSTVLQRSRQLSNPGYNLTPPFSPYPASPNSSYSGTLEPDYPHDSHSGTLASDYPHAASYPGFSSAPTFQQQGGYPPSSSLPGTFDPSFSSITPPAQGSTPRRSSPSRIVGLIFLFIIVALLVGGGAFYMESAGMLDFIQIPQLTTTPPAHKTPVVAHTPVVSTPSPTPAPIDLSKQIVQSFYQYLNNQDYSDAYALFGTTMRANQSYDNFKQGFSNTAHDDLSIDSASQLSDSTYKVNVTIVSTSQQDPNAPVTYKGYYIIDQENGVDKIQTANIQKIS